ncbi:carboxypeptidase-like regulatory domain-containing protein [Phocaeicola dorei]|nr:carboxypeptidase-like regulatory domain-containing protein [Phocaeicola dorei]
MNRYWFLRTSSLVRLKVTVIDANGEVVIGASVVVKGTANGTITDIDGNFILSDVPTNGTIQVSFVGYKTLEIPVKGQTSFSLTLMDDTEVLDEVVVVGYDIMKKSDLTGSVGSISSEKLAARGTTRLEDALQGAVRE